MMKQKAVRPLLSNFFKGGKEVPITGCIIHILDIHICLTNVKTIIEADRSIKEIYDWHIYLLGKIYLHNFSIEES